MSILPFELLSINNIDLRREMQAKYQNYTIEIESRLYILMLNNENEYLITISNNEINVISTLDSFPRKYLDTDTYFISYSCGKWIMHALLEKIVSCTKCKELCYYLTNDMCEMCSNWFFDKRKIDDRIKVFTIDTNYLHLPLSKSEDAYKMKIYIDDTIIHEFDINLAKDEPEYYSTIDLSKYIKSNCTIVVDELPKNHKGLLNIYSSNEKINIDNTNRPQLRYSQAVGWINDPNGLCYFNGYYHFFYQYNPFGIYWGNCYWGHAVSTDLVYWTELQPALYPNVFASGMCWSGSANVINDKMVAVFTDTNKGECVAFSDDGNNWVLAKYNPIIKHTGRDSKLIKYDDNFVIVVYSKHDDLDSFAFYTSTDLKSWNLEGYIDGFRECPDMFELAIDGNVNMKKWILMGFNNEYMIGDFNGKMFIPDSGKKQKTHYGLFQAAQCFSNIKERTIQIGWIPIDIEDQPFNQLFSTPLELSLVTVHDTIKLHVEPINELSKLRYNERILSGLVDSNNDICINVDSDLLDITISANMEIDTVCVIKFADNIIEFGGGFINNGKLNMRIIIDKYVYEIFGVGYYSANKLIGNKISKINISANGGKIIVDKLVLHNMQSILN